MDTQSPQMINDAVKSLEPALIAFLQKLVQTPSLPDQEGLVQKIIAAKLRSLGMEVEIHPVRFSELKHHPAFNNDGFSPNERVNVVGCWKGTSPPVAGAGSLILNGHVDVVPVGDESAWSSSPWSGVLQDGKLYGRGACDMKGGLAAAIYAVEVLQNLGYRLADDILVESVIGEETGGAGTLATIIDGYTADAAIILEPTRLAACPVQSGALTFRLRVPGYPIHAAMKKYGVSAIEKFALILHAIQDLEIRRHQQQSSPFFEDPNFVAPINIGTIKGGEWPSTVPGEVVAEGRMGVFPGETIGAARQELKDAIVSTAEKDPFLKDHPPEVEWFEGQFESGQTSMDQPIIRTLSETHQQMLAETLKFEGVTWGADLRLFTNHARIPTVLYGPGDVRLAHAVDEYVEVGEVLNAVKVIALTMIKWCGGRRI